VNNMLYVPVRINDAGFLTLRTGRLESGERIGMAFTSVDSLSFTLGPAQQWVILSDKSLRDMLAPLGIGQLRVDPLPLGHPGPGGIPRQSRKRPAPHSYAPVTAAHTTAWVAAFRTLSEHYWQRPGRWPASGHHPLAHHGHRAKDNVRVVQSGRLGRRAPARYVTGEGGPRPHRQPKDAGDATEH